MMNINPNIIIGIACVFGWVMAIYYEKKARRLQEKVKEHE